MPGNKRRVLREKALPRQPWPREPGAQEVATVGTAFPNGCSLWSRPLWPTGPGHCQPQNNFDPPRYVNLSQCQQTLLRQSGRNSTVQNMDTEGLGFILGVWTAGYDLGMHLQYCTLPWFRLRVGLGLAQREGRVDMCSETRIDPVAQEALHWTSMRSGCRSSPSSQLFQGYGQSKKYQVWVATHSLLCSSYSIHALSDHFSTTTDRANYWHSQVTQQRGHQLVGFPCRNIWS